MTDDELRAALSRVDPAPLSVPPLSPELLERTMTTTAEPALDPFPAPRRSPRLLAAAAAVLLAVAGVYVLTSGSDEAPEGEAIELALPGSDTTMMSCLPISEGVSALQAMEVAFAGTATAVSDEQVELEVERWYRGGDAGRVLLRNAPEVQQALLGATRFEVGEDYLVSAGQDAVVSVCGLSGPASPELQAVYDEAYGG